MKFLSLLSTLMLAVTATSVVRRDTLTDIQTVNSDIRLFITRLQSYDGSVGGIFPIEQQYLAYTRNLNTTIANLRSTCTFDTKQCSSLTNYLTNPLFPSLNTSFSTILTQKPKYRPVVLDLVRRWVGPQPRSIFQNFCQVLQSQCPSGALNNFCSNVQTAFANTATALG